MLVAVAVLAVVGLIYLATQPDDSGTPAGLALLAGQKTVPQLIGLTQQQAQTAVADAGLKLGQVSESPTSAVAPGLVIEQSPSASTKVKADSSVNVSVSVVPVVVVPDVVGQTQSEATAALAKVELVPGTITYVYDSKVEAGYVKSQDPASGTETNAGTSVALTVSKGEQTGQVPNVVGLSETDATAALSSAGFKVTTTKASSLDVAAGKVMSQSPAAGTVVTAGSNVTITVSKGAPAAPSTPATPTTPSTPETPTAPQPPSPTKVTVPNVVGMGVFDAIRTLWDADLKFSLDFADSSEGFLDIVSQDPDAETKVDPETTVTIAVGLPGIFFGNSVESPSEPEQAHPLYTTPTPQPAEPPTSSPSSSTTP